MKRYYHFDTDFMSLRDGLRELLHDNGIYYELSDGRPGFLYHFEILTDHAGAVMINTWLDAHTTRCHA